MIEVGGRPRDWIVRGGRPAAALGHDGMPSYVHEDGEMVVFDFAVVATAAIGPTRLFPRSYGVTCLLAPDDTVALHHSPDAWWSWRPQLYRRGAFDNGFVAMGSQEELGWRAGLSEMMGLAADRDEPAAVAEHSMPAAVERADELLVEHLTPTQRLDLCATGDFRVRGAATGNLYLIQPGDGFSIIDKLTHEVTVSYCLHPDGWIPNADVALATKLALEDPELEAEVLANARYRPRPHAGRPTARDRLAARMEDELVAAGL